MSKFKKGDKVRITNKRFTPVPAGVGISGELHRINFEVLDSGNPLLIQSKFGELKLAVEESDITLMHDKYYEYEFWSSKNKPDDYDITDKINEMTLIGWILVKQESLYTSNSNFGTKYKVTLLFKRAVQ